jgi:hypothetical protein
VKVLEAQVERGDSDLDRRFEELAEQEEAPGS